MRYFSVHSFYMVSTVVYNGSLKLLRRLIGDMVKWPFWHIFFLFVNVWQKMLGQIHTQQIKKIFLAGAIILYSCNHDYMPFKAKMQEESFCWFDSFYYLISNLCHDRIVCSLLGRSLKSWTIVTISCTEGLITIIVTEYKTLRRCHVLCGKYISWSTTHHKSWMDMHLKQNKSTHINKRISLSVLFIFLSIVFRIKLE